MMTQPEVETVTTSPPETTTDVQYVVISDEELEKPYRVIVENDDKTPMDFVVMVLRLFFGLTIERATSVMLEAHYEGHAYVASFPFAEARDRIYAAHTAARQVGYPLTFYLEPDD
ncbi:MAG: ATP-dependent Clp protease adaptor ClpS [Chloroflexaceae bacterium]|nr:ATP-dependent Clp protease adaptor ClpS [Chloroflexaceae bacterium]